MSSTFRWRILTLTWALALCGGVYLGVLWTRLATIRQASAEDTAPRLVADPGESGHPHHSYDSPERRLERANRVLALARSGLAFHEAQEWSALEAGARAAQATESEQQTLETWTREFQSFRQAIRDERDRFTAPEQLTDQVHRMVAERKSHDQKVKALLGDTRARAFFDAERAEVNNFGTTHSPSESFGGGDGHNQRGEH